MNSQAPDTGRPLTRSEVMQRIRSRNTGPELQVRRALHAAGLRYRLHVRSLPGTPDIVLARYGVVVEVRGCFWHQHPGCSAARVPATRTEYWTPKLAANVERDRRNVAALRRLGWKVVVIWACRITASKMENLLKNIQRNLTVVCKRL